jgi:hypothetical protein
VEDTSGCPYCMDEIDDVFLNKFNKDHTTLSEDDFEKIMYQFESITKDKLPHLHLVRLFLIYIYILCVCAVAYLPI